MALGKYHPEKVEAKWQNTWDKSGCFHVEPDQDKPKYYIL